MITVKCTYANDDTITTKFNGTIQEAEKYFLNQTVNIGTAEDNLQKCIKIEVKVYAVEQKYYDKGHVEANTHLLNLPSVPKSYSEEHRNYDLYVDYFTDPVEAEDFRQEALNA